MVLSRFSSLLKVWIMEALKGAGRRWAFYKTFCLPLLSESYNARSCPLSCDKRPFLFLHFGFFGVKAYYGVRREIDYRIYHKKMSGAGGCNLVFFSLFSLFFAPGGLKRLIWHPYNPGRSMSFQSLKLSGRKVVNGLLYEMLALCKFCHFYHVN